MKCGAKACLLVTLLVLLPLSVIGNESQSKFRLGFQAGGSIGLSSEYSRHSSGHMWEDDDLDVHFGGYFQYDLAELLALQFSVDYQHGSRHWTFFYPGMPEDSGTDPLSCFLINLNAVFNAKKGKNLQFFFIAGGGLTGSGNASGSGFNLGGGPGLRLFLSPDSPTAVIFGATFHHVWSADSSGGGSEFIRFSAGLEFALPEGRNR